MNILVTSNSNAVQGETPRATPSFWLRSDFRHLLIDDSVTNTSSLSLISLQDKLLETPRFSKNTRKAVFCDSEK